MLEYQILNNPLWKWMFIVFAVVISLVIGKIVYFFAKTVLRKVTRKTKTKLDDIFIDMIEEPIIGVMIFTGIYAAVMWLELPPLADLVVSKIVTIFYTFIFVWFVTRFGDRLIIHYMAPLTERTESKLDDQLIPIMRKGLKVTVYIIGVLVILDNIGYNITSLLAGLGIGGIALAMAAKDTLSNVFGGFTIFADKPFTIGDRVRIHGHDGTVEEVGIRSTRIRTLDGTLVTVPNKEFSENMVENVTSEPARKVKMNLGVSYGMSAKEMKKVKDMILKILKNTKGVQKDKSKVMFTEFGDFSLNLLILYYITNKKKIFDIKDEINMKIKEMIDKNKIDIPFPTQTIEVRK